MTIRKYVMENPQDYRGQVKLIWKEGNVEIAYTVSTDESLEVVSPEEMSERGIVVDVPSEVTMRQARLVLLQYGLLDVVEEAIGSLTGTEGKMVQIEWEYSNVVARESGIIDQLQPVLGLTKEQLDEMFVIASRL